MSITKSPKHGFLKETEGLQHQVFEVEQVTINLLISKTKQSSFTGNIKEGAKVQRKTARFPLQIFPYTTHSCEEAEANATSQNYPDLRAPQRSKPLFIWNLDQGQI